MKLPKLTSLLESVQTLLESGSFKYSQYGVDRNTGEGTYIADTKRLDEVWRKSDPEGYIGRGGIGDTIGNRYDQFKEFLKTGERIHAPSIGVDEKGSLHFTDGRHRFSVLRDYGEDEVVVSMSPQSAKRAKDIGILTTGEVVDLPVTKRTRVRPN